MKCGLEAAEFRFFPLSTSIEYYNLGVFLLSKGSFLIFLNFFPIFFDFSPFFSRFTNDTKNDNFVSIVKISYSLVILYFVKQFRRTLSYPILLAPLLSTASGMYCRNFSSYSNSTPGTQ
jgi:hypothetical protein